ncbi:DUF1643 domain-containing protein [Rhizosaccharibacter radicis]|uniref:DUF1643 domain-containing protein n=1 Tax=Rhizosaccharibacter radicis TaxID=2782605 RepID=A0ABT1VYV8_9PROT|nr:DUF1643 domain-containing protein [Acetobacteraceae bacterium KSS12]
MQQHDPGGRIRVRWPADSTVTARFSACDRYRWELREVWNPRLPLWLFLLMNPSIAGIRFSDPTVGKTGQIARYHGAGGQIIANTGAYRSTCPAGLLQADDPIGPENEETIMRCAREAGMVIAAYGQPPAALRGVGLRLSRRIVAEGIPLHVFRLSQDGTPMHPLSRGKGFIPIGTVPVPWVPPDGGEACDA